ncbi:MAG: hypothetical protein PHD10_01535 [Bacilli bacterium]|nr:hypothetical protein [Bacilli bacterium]MDD4607805.1 hypothetical protein [Bacilli bacterium]
MEMLEQVKLSLEQNPHIDLEVKTDIEELMRIFNSKLPNVNLNNFNERIKNLKISGGNRFIVKDAIEYDGINNVLYINGDELEKSNGKNTLMIGLLNIISANGKYSGFNNNNQLVALNVGFTEMLADFLVGNGSDFDE